MEAKTIVKIVIILLDILKLILNGIAIYFYHRGDEGYFMGASYNKNHDSESYVSGVFIGFSTFTKAQILSHIFIFVWDRKNFYKLVPLEAIINFAGIIMWICAGSIIVHFWLRFIPSNHFTETNPAATGIAMGCISLVIAAIYLIETILMGMNYFIFVQSDASDIQRYEKDVVFKYQDVARDDNVL